MGEGGRRRRARHSQSLTRQFQRSTEVSRFNQNYPGNLCWTRPRAPFSGRLARRDNAAGRAPQGPGSGQPRFPGSICVGLRVGSRRRGASPLLWARSTTPACLVSSPGSLRRRSLITTTGTGAPFHSAIRTTKGADFTATGDRRGNSIATCALTAALGYFEEAWPEQGDRSAPFQTRAAPIRASTMAAPAGRSNRAEASNPRP